jgi:hypothetical protein
LKSKYPAITDKPEYIEFLNNLLDEKNVGNEKFIKLFSLRFGLPVVCVRDHQNQAEVFSLNYVAKRVRSFCRLGQDYKGPESDILEAIFLWQHTTTAYTLLEPLSGQHDINPESLVLTDVYVKPLENDNHYNVEKEQSAQNSKSDEEDLWDQELFKDVSEEKKAAEQKSIQEKKDAEAKTAAAAEKSCRTKSSAARKAGGGSKGRSRKAGSRKESSRSEEGGSKMKSCGRSEGGRSLSSS